MHLAFLGVAALGRATYGWLVPDLGAQRPRWLTEPDHAAGDDLLDCLGAQLDSAVLAGNRVELLENGVEIFPAMLESIAQANESVDFLTYVYWTGDIAQRMASALADAARRGVRVRVLLDAYGAQKMNDNLVRSMEDAGVQMAWFKRSFELNNEIVLMVDDPGFARCLDASFEKDLVHASRIGLDGVRKRPLPGRATSGLALLLRPYL